MPKKLNILSIDGGGVRGIIPLYFLKQLESHLQTSIRELFDVFAGTSTGAIITSSIMIPHPDTKLYNNIDQILDLYVNRSNQIFIQKEHSNTKYSSQGLQLMLSHFFGNTHLKDLEKKIMIPVQNLTLNRQEIITNWLDVSDNKYAHSRMDEILLGASASQGFFNPTQVNKMIIADGVEHTKNPTMEIIKLGLQNGFLLKDMNVISIGTGDLDTYDPIEEQAITTDIEVKHLFDSHRLHDHYIRLQAPIVLAKKEMDDTSTENLEALLEDAKNAEINNHDSILKAAELLTI